MIATKTGNPLDQSIPTEKELLDASGVEKKSIKMVQKKIKRPFQDFPLVEIIWDDAAGLRHGWLSKTDPLVPQLALSVGFLIKEDNDHIVIAQDTDAEGSHNGRSQVPKGMVKHIKVLRKADKPKENGKS